MENNMINYKIHGKKGIDDLISCFPYNEYGDYFGRIPEDEYLKDVDGYINKVKEENDRYIRDLEVKGEYGEPYTIDINFVHNELFDNPKINGMEVDSDNIKMSSNFIILDFSNEKDNKKT